MWNSAAGATPMPGLLLIAGQGQNVGKTTFACSLISHFSRNNTIYGLKISPHFHANTGNAIEIEATSNWKLMEETTFDSGKDTSRMLQAGAERAFLIQGNGEYLSEALNSFRSILPQNTFIICESAGILEYAVPGLFFMIRRINCQVCSIKNNELLSRADRIVTFTGNGFDFSATDIEVSNSEWKLKEMN